MEPLVKSAELNLGRTIIWDTEIKLSVLEFNLENLIWDTHKLNERFKFMGVPN